MSRRPKLKTEMDRAMVAKMALAGATIRAMAKECGTGVQTAHGDLQAVIAQWRQVQQTYINQAKFVELARLNKIEAEAWGAWELSQADAVESTIEGPVDQTTGAITTASATRRTRGQTGNPAFLQVALRCHERRCKIMGLDAPDRLEVTNGNVWDRLRADLAQNKDGNDGAGQTA